MDSSPSLTQRVAIMASCRQKRSVAARTKRPNIRASRVLCGSLTGTESTVGDGSLRVNTGLGAWVGMCFFGGADALNCNIRAQGNPVPGHRPKRLDIGDEHRWFRNTGRSPAGVLKVTS